MVNKKKAPYNKENVNRRNNIIFQRYLELRKKRLGVLQVYELLSSVLWYCGDRPTCLTPDTIKRIIYAKKYARGEKKRKYRWRRKQNAPSQLRAKN